LVADAGGGVSSVMFKVTRKDTPWRRIALSGYLGQEEGLLATRYWLFCATARGAC
jgi:hypothetical protein